MNPMLKSLLWVVAGVATVMVGLRFQQEREIAGLQQEEVLVAARAAELVREATLLRAKLEQAGIDSRAAAEFENQYTTSVATIAAEQKKIGELVAKWPAVEAERAAAVQAVREKEATRPPMTITLTDGTKLEQLVVRSVPNETTVSVEHSNGLLKLGADKLPEDLKARLGLGWKPEPPPALTIDKDGNAVVRKAPEQGAGSTGGSKDKAMDLGLGKMDTTSMEGVSKGLVAVEAELARTQAAFEAERANIRKLGIFKSDVKIGGKTYGVLKKEANARLASLAGRIQALRGEQSNLQHKLKSF